MRFLLLLAVLLLPLAALPFTAVPAHANSPLRDAALGEAMASGSGDYSYDEYLRFLKRYPAFPNRRAILAASESLLIPNNPPLEILALYSRQTLPVTTNGLDAYVNALIATGRNDEAAAVVENFWISPQFPAGQERDFRARYRGFLGASPPPARYLAIQRERWRDTNIEIRELINARQYRRAQQLAANHNLPAGEKFLANDYATAEFLAGWLALRFLNQPDAAAAHFQTLYDNVSMPVSKARGAYWLGRTFEAKRDTASAKQWYEAAASYPTVFYGQLAMAKLSARPVLRLPAEPAVPASVRAEFLARPLPRIVQALIASGDDDRAAKYLNALTNDLTSRADFVLAVDLARSAGAEFMEIEAVKDAAAKGHVINRRGYPVLPATAKTREPEAALTHALIRQESEFRPEVESPAGALGLMQLLPSTARAVARALDLPYSESRLLQPAYNIQLGRHYLQRRIEDFNGSYIMAIAAYNAGQGRVRQWQDSIGDPQDASIDPIDWIELIPIYETRNYVQRVLEGTQVYRAILSGKHEAPLGIVQDLQR